MSSASSSGPGGSRQPKAPAWKGSRAATVQRRTTAASSGTTWRKERDPEERPQVGRIIAVLLAVALFGAFLYFAIVRPRATPLVVFAAEPYPLRMPPLAFAQEDTALLESIAPQNLQVRKEYRAALQHLDGSLDQFKAAIRAAGKSSRNLIPWRDQAIVIHLAVHGAVDDRGACLIPPAADPFDSRQWLPLKDVLAALKDEPAMSGKRKLLVLDCQRVLSSWRTGLLENRFAEELPRAVEEADDPNLYVFASASAGQLAWPAPELRGSVFGHFLARGLRGEANPEGKTVSLEQLVAYVIPQVESYVAARRAARQQPVLFHTDGQLTINAKGYLTLGEAEVPKHNFSLVYVDSARRATDLAGMQSQFDALAEARKLVPATSLDSAALSPSAPPPAAWQASYSLPDVWRLYDEHRAGQNASGRSSLPAYVVDPVAWASIQQRLAAIHERLLAGAAYQPSLPDRINELGRDLAADQWRVSGKRPPLALFNGEPRATASRPPSAAQADRDNFLEAYLKEQDPAKKAELAKRNVPREKIIADIYSLFTRANRPIPADDWQAAQQLLGLHPPSAEGDSLDGHFFTLLQKGLRTSDSSFAALVPRALALRQAAEAAAGPNDIRTHYAAEPLLNDSDAKRREAEDQLFLADPRQQAATLFSIALDGDEQVAGYRKTIEHQEKLAEAYRLRDEVWSELPLVAEWIFLRRKLASSSAADETALSARASDQLVELIGQSIDLNDQLEQVARSRDEAGTFVRRLADCQTAAGALAATWRDVRAGLDEIASPLVTREDRYLPGRDIREVELVTKTALLAPEFPRTILGLYLKTLDEWTKAELPELRRPTGTESAAAAGTPAERKFLEQLHRLLAYEFRVGYDKHLVSTAWEGETPADRVFRGTASGNESSWVRLHELLDKYDEEMQRARSPVWDSARSALAASQELRTWDRRARVAAPWLSSFSDDLGSPVQPRPGQAANHATPARWLQEFDSAHLIAWQAARAASDFWGSGDATPGSGPPFFAAAARRCEDVLQTLGSQYAPLRYDPPAAGAADVLIATQDSALAALRKWDPLKLPGVFSPPAGPDAQPTVLRIDIQPAARDPLLQIPAGTGALSVPPAALGSSGGIRFSSDPAGKQPAYAVKMPLTNSEAIRVQAYAHFDQSASAADPQVAARLWYRGHVRSAVLPISGPPQFVETLHQRKPYSVPTIEVRGKDTPRGSVMFIFDCSASMRTPDGRFKDAKSEFQKLLRFLDQDAGDGLHLGLRFYGRKSGPGRPPANPNPDRDLTQAVAIGPNKTKDLLAEMNGLQVEDCVGGATPLYFAIRQALENAFPQADQREQRTQHVLIISDGVNMPFNIRQDPNNGNIAVMPAGRQTNDEDYAALQDALKRNPQTRVTVVLFGDRRTKVENDQYDALVDLEKKARSFKVIALKSAKDIAQSIIDSFPKTGLELASASAASQSLALNQETPVSPWQPADGTLRSVSDQRELLVRVAGEANTTLKKPLALVGGEKVVLQYDSQSNPPSLRLLAEQRRERANEPATVKRGLAEPALDLRVAALDPYRRGGVLDTLFVRLRHEQLAQQFTPRPRYAWAEIDPVGAPAAEPTIPVIDAAWEDHTELPVLQIPVRGWPSLATQAKIRLWFRYNDPREMLAQATLRRGQSTPPLEPAPGSSVRGRWVVEESAGEAEQERQITVTFEPAGGEHRYENLLEQAVWLSPPPDRIHRRLAKDGGQAIHEFTYTRPGLADAQLDLRIVSRQQFELGAYYAELTANVVD